jgi:hypothetical protein
MWLLFADRQGAGRRKHRDCGEELESYRLSRTRRFQCGILRVQPYTPVYCKQGLTSRTISSPDHQQGVTSSADAQSFAWGSFRTVVSVVRSAIIVELCFSSVVSEFFTEEVSMYSGRTAHGYLVISTKQPATSTRLFS